MRKAAPGAVAPGVSGPGCRRDAVVGVHVIEPPTFEDDRGRIATPFHEDHFRRVVGRPPFRVAQSIVSRSRRGVVRGVHFSLPPSRTEKFVTCVHGEVLDLAVDLRTGSPTFGRWSSVVLTDSSGRGVYLPPGVGHGFVVRGPGATVSYLLSEVFDPAVERAVSVHDPHLALPVPGNAVLSNRDREAPSLAAWCAGSELPRYEN